MSVEIAVFLNSKGKTVTLNESGIIKVFLKQGEEWRVIKKIIFESEDSISLKIFRDNVKKMAEALEKCRVFVASEVKGIPYTILDSMGFNTWELDGFPDDFLEFVLKNEENEKDKRETPETVPVPIKNGIGENYFIDLKTEIQNNSKFSSKQILLPFLHNIKFKELEIICGHVPPWFEGEFKNLNLQSTVEVIRENTFKVTVYSKDDTKMNK